MKPKFEFGQRLDCGGVIFVVGIINKYGGCFYYGPQDATAKDRYLEESCIVVTDNIEEVRRDLFYLMDAVRDCGLAIHRNNELMKKYGEPK